MNNANTPAMPLSGDAYQDFAAYDGTNKTGYNPECQGLTKRETVAMHILAGICANPNYEPEQQRHFDLATEDALRQADSFFKGLKNE